jgi:hypothetical protein
MYQARVTMLARRLWSESGLLDLRANCCILAKMVQSRGARCFAMFSYLRMLFMMTPATLFLSLKSISGLYFLSLKSLAAAAYPHSVVDHR